MSNWPKWARLIAGSTALATIILMSVYDWREVKVVIPYMIVWRIMWELRPPWGGSH